MTRFDFAFSRPLSWPLALLGVTPWTAHVDVTDDEFSVRFGPWSLVTPLSNVEGARITGPYLPFKVLGPHISLVDRGVSFGTNWQRGVCVRFRSPVPAALPVGLLRHPAVTVTVTDAERLVSLLERRPAGTPGDGDELREVARTVLQSVPDPGRVEVTGVEDAAAPAPTPVPRRPLKRTTTRSSTRPSTTTTSTTGTTPSTGTEAPTTAGATDQPADPPASGSAAPRRRPAKRATRSSVPGDTTPEHPTPADMPKHTPTEKVPGVTPPEDAGLPGPDQPRA